MAPRKPQRHLDAIVVDRRSAKARKVEARSFTRLEPERLVAILDENRVFAHGQHGDSESHVLLDARVPWVEDHGYLDALNPRSWYTDSPSVNFVPEAGQPTGRLDIWLHGLQPESGYLARIEVGASVDRAFDIRAVTTGADLVAQIVQTDGGFSTLLLPFSTGGSGGLGLVRVEADDWSFYEAEISLFSS